MKVRLINVGRNDVNAVVDVKNWNALRKEVGKYVLSRGFDFDDTDDPNRFEIVAGFRTVGEIEIIKQ